VSPCEPTYRALKLLTREQYDSLLSGDTALPEGITIQGAREGVKITVKGEDVCNDSSMLTVAFDGVGIGAYFSFQQIPCVRTLLILPVSDASFIQP